MIWRGTIPTHWLLWVLRCAGLRMLDGGITLLHMLAIFAPVPVFDSYLDLRHIFCYSLATTYTMDQNV
jgi:hypothetical protein